MSQYDKLIASIKEWARDGGRVSGAQPYTDEEIANKGRVGGAYPYTDAEIAAQEQAVKDSTNVIDLNAPEPVPPMPTEVNNIDLNAPEGIIGVQGPGGPVAPAAPPAPENDLLPTPVDPKNALAQLGGAPIAKMLGLQKTGVQANSAVPQAAQRAATIAPAEATPPVAPPPAATPDDIAKGLKDKESGLLRERQDALAKALGEQNLSTEEKVVIALLGALPGILGGIGGGILGGGAGAAAGVAGGLRGGADGIKMIADDKTGRRKDALAQADKIAGRIDQVGAQQLERQGTLDQRAFTHGENAASLSSHERMSGADNKARERLTLINNKAEMDRLQATLTAKASVEGGAAPKQADKDFYANLDTAFNKINELETTVKKHGNWESRLGDPAASATLEQAPYELAIAYAKLVDPTSVAREGEVEAAKKYMVQLGLTTPNGVTLEALSQLRKSLLQKASSRQQLGTPLPQSAYDAAAGAAAAGAAPTTNHQKYGF